MDLIVGSTSTSLRVRVNIVCMIDFTQPQVCPCMGAVHSLLDPGHEANEMNLQNSTGLHGGGSVLQM